MNHVKGTFVSVYGALFSVRNVKLLHEFNKYGEVNSNCIFKQLLNLTDKMHRDAHRLVQGYSGSIFQGKKQFNISMPNCFEGKDGLEFDKDTYVIFQYIEREHESQVCDFFVVSEGVS